MSQLPRTPVRPPARSPSDPRYYDARDLEHELRRAFQICHECRMCVGYCGAFPELLSRVDRDIEQGRAEGAERLDDVDIRAVADECWQCKLCYIKCPYTQDEGAAELLDFPRLMAREKAVRARRDGVPVVDRLLGEPQLIGALGSGLAAHASNLVQTSRLLRKLQQVALGVSSEFRMPQFAAESFPRWFHRHESDDLAGEKGDVVLFATCYGNFNTPAVPQAAVRVLEHLGYRVRIAPETCCGMPNLDGGQVDRFVDKVRSNARALLPAIAGGLPLLVASPTCGYTMKREWSEYVDEPDVARVSAAVVDLMEFIDGLRKQKALRDDVKRGLGTVAYHAPCHLRAQKIGFPAARLLGKLLPDTEVRVIEQCAAVDGTWGMKAHHFATGRRYAGKLTRAIEQVEPDWVLSDCSLSMLRIEQENERPAIHPIEALAWAYGLGPEPAGGSLER